MYTPATWTEEAEGNFQLPIDEFTTYKTMEIDGVTTFTGIRYAFGMNKGTVDIPMAGLTDQFGTETGPDVGGQEVEIENKKMKKCLKTIRKTIHRSGNTCAADGDLIEFYACT